MKARFFGQHFVYLCGGRAVTVYLEPTSRKPTPNRNRKARLVTPYAIALESCLPRLRVRSTSHIIHYNLDHAASSGDCIVCYEGLREPPLQEQFVFEECVCFQRLQQPSQLRRDDKEPNRGMTDFRKHLGRQMQQRRIKRGWYSWGGGARMRPRIRMISACWSERFQALGSLFR